MSVLERVRRAERFDDGGIDGLDGLMDERLRELKRAVKREMMERVGFAEVARMANSADAARSREELRPVIETVLNTSEAAGLDGPDRARIVSEILDDVVGLGPLQPLLDDESVTEIMVNGRASAFFERGGTLHALPEVFESDE